MEVYKQIYMQENKNMKNVKEHVKKEHVYKHEDKKYIEMHVEKYLFEIRQVGRQVYFAIKLFTNLETIKNMQLKYSTESKIYKIMAGMTQKELKKPYFHCGPI